ncbi:ANTAR domain-containing response regulator [Aminicella lysinilytica]|uniref:Response regulator receiver and ANTAR domain protein n=1 Tax=Aminicella lysinilytica TaxID=433323 RepID=A0A4R6QCM0_9FIRM|nr:ANTAR domain-containing protein [Aminicella lysinilytica]TDP60524.1 response regulator receiver and ANTAR domain protein [Aminicella lysinilytica]
MAERYYAMIVSAGEKTEKSISPILSSDGFTRTVAVSTAGTARKLVADSMVDLAIINSPLPDDFGTQLALDLAERNISVLIFVNRDISDQVASKVEPAGVVVLAKPVSRPELIQSIKILKVMRSKLRSLEARAVTVETKMKEISLVNRAKWLLIDRLKMSEEEAHRYIEKSAMDDCVSKSVIAQGIIKTYDS